MIISALPPKVDTGSQGKLTKLTDFAVKTNAFIKQ